MRGTSRIVRERAKADTNLDDGSAHHVPEGSWYTCVGRKPTEITWELGDWRVYMNATCIVDKISSWLRVASTQDEVDVTERFFFDRQAPLEPSRVRTILAGFTPPTLLRNFSGRSTLALKSR
ncbi:hypothetical protein MRX96_014593 [Rhipicephalus microplus]